MDLELSKIEQMSGNFDSQSLFPAWTLNYMISFSAIFLSISLYFYVLRKEPDIPQPSHPRNICISMLVVHNYLTKPIKFK